ncbi:MAG: hypothetical protein KIT31_23110 [Deltaproteobacteria bacterium]|nr:hypothetical protein [Deltaproteobacteria bacterium]
MLTLADVERAIANRDPHLGDVLVRYLDQSDPDPGRSELTVDSYYDDDDEDGDGSHDEVDVPSGAFTIDRLRQEVSGNLHGKNPTERKLARREAFASAEASPFAPPRLRLGKLLVELYEQGDPAARAVLIDVFVRGEMKWGVWYAAKTIYKRAEAEHDAAMFGALAYRFDAMTHTPYARREIGGGTLLYLRRRTWRFLRELGKAAPDAYPAFAVEVLRHYRSGHGGYSTSSWVAAHIWGHGNLRYARSSAVFTPPTHGDPMAARAFPAAWKLTPAPLLRLLEASENDAVCDWAIRCLRADHALALRAVEPAWLARLGRRSVGAIHTFVVALLGESPELHQSKLRELGLHEVVIGFLRSPSEEARTYALDYAAAHGSDISAEDLVSLVEGGEEDVQKFASARLEAMPGAKIGVALLLRLLGNDAATWAGAKLAQSAKPADVTVAQFIDTMIRSDEAFQALLKFFGDGAGIPTGHWTAFLDDKRVSEDSWQYSDQIEKAWESLGKRSARDIGIAWIQRALENSDHQDHIEGWLDEGKLSGPGLDIAWLKGLVGKPSVRATALRLLADRRHVAPARVGLTWLLDLARSPDEAISQFAQRMLLESFEPEDFAASGGSGEAAGGDAAGREGDRKKGVARLWELASGKKSPEPVRAFAATYLKAHHPELGKRLPEAKALGITPRLGPEAYAMSVVRPLANDDRADVRRLACAIIGEELVRWGDQDLAYELAGAHHAEPRGLGGRMLLGILVEGDVARVPAAWIDGRRLFQLAESGHKAAREVALTLIRRLYEQVGGAERLAWLMDSPERDVRLFAVRLFWDRHRPKPWPAGYAPRKNVGAAIGTDRFADLTSLRQFARVVLFGLPPGRVGERDPLIEGAPRPERALPASVAKRRLIEAMRDVALEDVELAKAIMPILGEFSASTAKGEWQASVQAVTALRATHKEALGGAA